jgi:hypothetical protein
VAGSTTTSEARRVEETRQASLSAIGNLQTAKKSLIEARTKAKTLETAEEGQREVKNTEQQSAKEHLYKAASTAAAEAAIRAKHHARSSLRVKCGRRRRALETASNELESLLREPRTF